MLDALKYPSSGQSRISGNLIVGSSDDAIELDGNHAPILIDGNLVVNAYANISYPLPGGPITVMGNLFLNGPANGHNTWLKLLHGPISSLRLRDNLFWVNGSVGITAKILVNRSIGGTMISISPPIWPPSRT